jgi:hypothetical protein
LKRTDAHLSDAKRVLTGDHKASPPAPGRGISMDVPQLGDILAPTLMTRAEQLAPACAGEIKNLRRNTDPP